jgi:hypothetical protein
MFDSARQRFGDTVVVDLWDIHRNLQVIPLYNNLSMQYVLGVNGLPMGRFFNVVGGWGTFKSSLCQYLGAMSILHNGICDYVETEGKLNPFQIEAVLRHYVNLPEDLRLWRKHLMFFRVTTIEQLLQSDVWVFNEVKKNATPEDGPVLCINDSLGNVDMQGTVDIIQDVDAQMRAAAKAAKKQAAGEEVEEVTTVKGYADARKAAFISQQLKAFGGNLLEPLPLSYLVVNHQKVKLDDSKIPRPGGPLKTESGGEHQRFQYSSILELKQGKKMLIRGETVPVVDIQTKKNCFSTTGDRRISVPYKSLWLGRTDGREDIYLDWDAALTMLLRNEKELLTPQRNAMKTFLNITGEGSRCSCKELGLVDVDAATMGAAIHARPDICARLCTEVLMIRNLPARGVLRKDLLPTEQAKQQAAAQPYASKELAPDPESPETDALPFTLDEAAMQSLNLPGKAAIHD